jgi:hypothetical protein
MVASVIALLGLIFGIKWIGSSALTAYLKTHATPWGTPRLSTDGRFQIVLYRYPRLKDIPESFGFGQGFVQLQEVASGRVLAEKAAPDFAPLNWWRWSSNKVTVADFAEWDLPQ